MNQTASISRNEHLCTAQQCLTELTRYLQMLFKALFISNVALIIGLTHLSTMTRDGSNAAD